MVESSNLVTEYISLLEEKYNKYLQRMNMLKLNITPKDTKEGSSKIFIGNDITVEILRANKHRVDVGITAPKEIAILRENAKVKEKKDVGHTS